MTNEIVTKPFVHKHVWPLQTRCCLFMCRLCCDGVVVYGVCCCWMCFTSNVNITCFVSRFHSDLWKVYLFLHMYLHFIFILLHILHVYVYVYLQYCKEDFKLYLSLVYFYADCDFYLCVDVYCSCTS